VDYALDGLEAPLIGDQAPLIGDQARALARAFADGAPLPATAVKGGPIRTKTIIAELRGYLAAEIRRLARESGRAPAELADITDRALRKQVRKKGSGGAEP
jgi:hypothetical protein